MKKYWPTLFLVLLCAAGFWYASSQSWFQDPAESETVAKLLSGVNAQQASRLVLTSSEQTVELQREGSGWAMVQPKPYPVNRFMIEQWLTSFETISYTDKIEDQADNLAEFGLDTPSRQFSVQWSDGTQHTIAVGSASPVSAHYYARLDEGDAVYLIPEGSVASLTKEPLDLIEKNVFKLSYDQVEALEVEWKGQKWLLEKIEKDKAPYEAVWSLNDVMLEPAQGSALLDGLVTIYTHELPIPLKEYAQWAETPVDLKVEVTESTDEGVEKLIFTGHSEESSIRVHKEDAVWIYTANEAELEQWFQQGLAFLKDDLTH